MSTEQAGAATVAESEYVSMTDFRAFQSSSDSELSSIRRDLSESEAIISELNQVIETHRGEVRELRAQGYGEHSPEVAEALKERDEAVEKARKAQQMVKQFTPHIQRSTAEAMAWRFSQGNRTEAERAYGELLKAKNLREMETVERTLYAGAKPIPPPTTPTGDEVDAGRSGGRGGAPRITRDELAKHTPGDEWYVANRPHIRAAMDANGGRLPDR